MSKHLLHGPLTNSISVTILSCPPHLGGRHGSLLVSILKMLLRELHPLAAAGSRKMQYCHWRLAAVFWTDYVCLYSAQCKLTICITDNFRDSKIVQLKCRNNQKFSALEIKSVLSSVAFSVMLQWEAAPLYSLYFCSL